MPGFLSSLLSIGGTILGNAILPGVGGAIGGALGGALGGASDQSSASSSAADAQVQAQRDAIAAREKAAAQVATLQAPYVQAGYTGLNALTSRLGLPGGAVGGAVTAAQAAGPTGSPAPGNALSPSSPPPPVTVPASSTNALAPAAAAAGGYLTESMGTGGAPAATPLTGSTVDPPISATAPPPAATGPAPATPNALSPSTGPASGPGIDPGTYGNTANPTQPNPGNFSYTLADYTASPAYQYQQDQARKATIAGASATGALQSGAAMKALQDRAQNIAYQDFTGERAFNAGQFNLNRNFDQSVYDDSRNYLTNRFDTQTGNLFKYTGMGEGATTAVGNADLGVGTGVAAADAAIGNAQAGNALQQGQIGSNLAGQVGGLASSFASNYTGGSGTPLNLQTAPNALQFQAPPPTSATFVNPLPSFSY